MSNEIQVLKKDMRILPFHQAAIVGILSFISAVYILGGNLFGTTSLAAQDYFELIFPMYQYSQQVWKDIGHIPLWLPQMHGGMPLIASMNSMLLYPTELIAIHMGVTPNIFYAWDSLLHLVIAAVGGAFFLYYLGISGIGSIFGGLMYAYSGITISQIGVGTHQMLRAIALLPWLVTMVLRIFDRDIRAFYWAAIIMGLLLLTAAIQIVAFVILWFLLLKTGQNSPGL